ncbi:MAG: hypothetical protein Kow00120_22820 [Anaerolineae bacterium]
MARIDTPTKLTRFRLVVGLTAILCLAVVLLYAFLGIFVRYMADDYWWAKVAQEHGLWGAFEYWYTSFNGRFTTIFLQTLLALIGPQTSAIVPPVLIGTWLVASIWAVRQFSLVIGVSNPATVSVIFGALIVFTVIDGLPHPFQTVHWQSGALLYLFPLVVWTAYLGLIGYRLRRGKNRPSLPFLFLCGLLLFVSGGTTEVALVLQLGSLGLALLILAAWREGPAWIRAALRPVLIAGFVGTVIASLLLLPAPGNSVRQSLLPPMTSLLMRLRTFAWPMTNFLVSSLARHVLSVGVLLMIPAWVALRLHPQPSRVPGSLLVTPRRLRRATAALFEFAFALVALFFFPFVFLSVQIVLPLRSYSIPLWVVVWALVWIGYMIGLALRFTDLPHRVRASPPLRYGILALAIALVLLGPGKALLEGVAQIPVYADYAAAWEAQQAQIQEALQEGVADLEVAPLYNPWKIRMIGPMPNFSMNQHVADYYGLDSIYASWEDNPGWLDVED